MKTRDKIAFIVAAALIIAIIILSILCCKYSKQLKIANHNIDALNDTIELVKLNNGDLLYAKNSLIIEKEELEQYLAISKDEIKELEKKLKENVIYVSKLKENIKLDTIYIKDEVDFSDGKYTYYFKDSTQYYKIAGYTKLEDLENANTIITNNEINADLTVGLSDDWKIFVTSDNPYISFDTINGALLDKDYYLSKTQNVNNKKKKSGFNLGIQAGFGAQYGLMHKQFDYGPYIGVGLSWGFSF